MNQFNKRIIDFCLGILYPKRCVACEKVLLKMEKERGFCSSCAKELRYVGNNYCMKCGAPLKVKGAEYCRDCQENLHIYNQCKGVFRYEGQMKKALYRFKYSNRRSYGVTFAWHAHHRYGQWIKDMGIECIVPVPMYKPKEKRRGYNQAEVFAKALSDMANIPVESRIVKRENETVAMKELNGLKRKKNLLNAFITSENDVQFRKVLIVDDIYTTGTTMDEVARALKAAGVAEVYGMCICIGEI